MTDHIREAIDAINRAISILGGVPPQSIKLDGIYDRATAELLHARAMLSPGANKPRDFSDLGIDVDAEDDDELPDRALPAGLFEPLDDGDGCTIKRNPWEMLRQIDAALEPALSLTGDPEHQIRCHADTLPEAFLIVCEAVSKAHSVLCLTGEEMDALEPDTLPPPDEKTEPMAAPFAVTATGALKR